LGSLENLMTELEPGTIRSVKGDELSWRPSRTAVGVFVKNIAVTAGWEMVASGERRK
jgi:hypothetical protein